MKKTFTCSFLLCAAALAFADGVPIPLALEANGVSHAVDFASLRKSAKRYTDSYVLATDGLLGEIRVFAPKFDDELDVWSRPVRYVSASVIGMRDARLVPSAKDGERVEIAGFPAVRVPRGGGWTYAVGPVEKDGESVLLLADDPTPTDDWWRWNGKTFAEAVKDGEFAYRRLRKKADGLEGSFRGDVAAARAEDRVRRVVRGADDMPYWQAADGTRTRATVVIQDAQVGARTDGPAEFLCEYTDRVKRFPVMRGAMLTDCDVPEDDMKTMADWGAKLVRYQFAYFKPNKTKRGIWSDERLCAEYLKWIDAKIENVVQVLAWAEKYDLYVLVDLHDPPGGRFTKDDGSNGNRWHACRFFYNRAYLDCFMEAWRRIATRIKGHSRIYAYDIINEPHQQNGSEEKLVTDCWRLQYDAALLIRAIDPETPLSVASDWGGCPSSFLTLKPLPLKDVIYTVHTYRPYFYSFQGWNNEDVIDNTYPNPSRGLDRSALRRIMRGVKDFQDKFHARILVGEFSAMCMAPGCAEFIRDYIDLFEEYGWDWTYDAFREWSAWSVEHEGVRQGQGDFRFWPSADNPRKRVLLKALRRNKVK